MQEEELDVELLERANKSLRHAQQTQRMVEYRQEKKLKRIQLKQKVEELAQLRDALADASRRLPMTRLPWRDVAKALQEQRDEVESDKRTLERYLKEQRRLLHDMQQWVAVQLSLQASPHAGVPTWRNVSLLANPVSRRLGKEWILKHMYLNTDRVFQQYGFPPPNLQVDVKKELRFEFDDEGYVILFKEQLHSVKGSLQRQVSQFYHTLLSLQCMVVFYSPALSMVIEEVDGFTRQYAFVTPRGEFVNVLVGEFHSSNRCVIVGQEIQSDDSVADYYRHHQRNRTFWFDIYTVPDGLRTRDIKLHSHPFVLGGSNLDRIQDAGDFGLNLSDCPTHLHDIRLHMWAQRILDMKIADYRKPKQTPPPTT
ncbi:Aste57867_8634 [Aphanomyces stellatus]|uniref:Aste57867_8634 protein n=1 Tax=Aphanomyces stellatus TaxID=120398 RepID=A0A485KKT2_9STRA|nr:hypothetical protein As57867_008600 [Aphanomyces stellatus]VFT85520.1 Aste57867_8634 [Aphanomyces stellatus]